MTAKFPYKTIFSIESSCDETAAAIVADGKTLVVSSLATSREFHEKTGGVVPEVAARKQVEFIVPVIKDCLDKVPGDVVKNIDAVAVTVGPGLIGSLVVGVEAAKALSLAWNKPLIPVNHLVGHIYGNFLNQDKVILPAVVLIVSGGHTDLIYMKDHGNFEYLGGTYDDAAGECFDKTARLLGIADYLGGALLSKEAAKVSVSALKGLLPRPLIHEDNFDFSFSGLKTAVKRYFEKNPQTDVPSLAREFEDAVVEVLVSKTIKAAKKHVVSNILLGGGVSANSRLRTLMTESARKENITVYCPPLELCTDNAIYIASAAYFNPMVKNLGEVHANPSLGVMDRV